MNPRLLVVVSIFFIGYGIVDILFVNYVLGVALLLIGVWMNVSAYKKRKAARAAKE
ncbi:hypothetical protein [Paenibacillus sacheonensis]|uniref:Uncharacterized protein n=1 Tax=Paenibacillus sacheonensis TaxID=742054 RepID=A0A7X4YR26_9BACL|nr:hypothetical protein [Paenibacillus sacheonensis]MBM7565210.1 uncharacterized membrane protein HdeD (DUF308 family) [Paenibacillus sacheonensis]NBC70014.1 hypothetical protein [Paenibacillus sacheonensis]